MDIDTPSLAWEEAEPPPPPPPPWQQWSPSPLPLPEKPEKKPQLTGWMTRFGYLPSPEVVVVNVVKGDSQKVTAFFTWCITFFIWWVVDLFYFFAWCLLFSLADCRNDPKRTQDLNLEHSSNQPQRNNHQPSSLKCISERCSLDARVPGAEHMMWTRTNQKTFTTPNKMKKPWGKFVPPPPGPGNERGIKPLTLQEFLPGYTHSWHHLTIISPLAKQKIAQKIAEKALQNLGKTVAQAAEVNTSFDHDSYIQSLTERAAKGKD